MAIDFVKFAVDAIKIIDEIRSTNADPKNVDSNSAKSVESRTNAFYRAVGLPAFTTSKNKLDKFNNGNIFESDPEDKRIIDFIRVSDKRERNFSLELSEEMQKSILDNDNIGKTILSSIKRSGEFGSRLKGGLFPMMVNGNVNVMPQSKRVGGAFFQKDSDLEKNDVVYRRPLIELIVLLRLRSKGFVNSSDEEKLQNDFGGVEITVDGKKTTLSDTGFFDGSGENLLTIQILISLLQAVVDPEGITKIVEGTIKRLGKVRDQVRETFKDSKDATVAEEQPITGESDELGQLEKQKAERETLKAESNAKITLLEYDDTISSNASKSEVTKNMKNALFAPMILATLLSDTEEIDETIEEGEKKKESLDLLHKKLNKNMDLITGEYSGISGIDILIVITALFSIDESDLLGLLNKESMDRLDALKKPDELLVGVDVHKAIGVLEAKTKEIYEIFNGKVTNSNIIEKNIKAEG